MSQVLLCDECGEKLPEEMATHWYRVDHAGAYPDHHFCSSACLSNWADVQA